MGSESIDTSTAKPSTLAGYNAQSTRPSKGQGQRLQRNKNILNPTQCPSATPKVGQKRKKEKARSGSRTHISLMQEAKTLRLSHRRGPLSQGHQESTLTRQPGMYKLGKDQDALAITPSELNVFESNTFTTHVAAAESVSKEPFILNFLFKSTLNQESSVGFICWRRLQDGR